MKGLLRSSDDEDLLGIAGDAAVGAQMGSDGPAQMRMAAWLAIAHHVVAAAAPMLGRKTMPTARSETHRTPAGPS